jgi:hypothetical protein
MTVAYIVKCDGYGKKQPWSVFGYYPSIFRERQKHALLLHSVLLPLADSTKWRTATSISPR